MTERPRTTCFRSRCTNYQNLERRAGSPRDATGPTGGFEGNRLLQVPASNPPLVDLYRRISASPASIIKKKKKKKKKKKNLRSKSSTCELRHRDDTQFLRMTAFNVCVSGSIRHCLAGIAIPVSKRLDRPTQNVNNIRSILVAMTRYSVIHGYYPALLPLEWIQSQMTSNLELLDGRLVL
jgi:hypothetical protein